MSDTIRPHAWAVVRLRSDCSGDGRRAHDPAEDGARVMITVVDKPGDHPVFALYNGRLWKNAAGRPRPRPLLPPR